MKDNCNISEWNEEDMRIFDEKSKFLYQTHDVDVERALTRTKKRIKFRKKGRIIGLRSIAAVLLISLAVSAITTIGFHDSIHSYLSDYSEDSVVYQEVNTISQTRTKLTLADGTKVWLNAGSSLKFPVSFKNSSNRKIELEGEGYFEVYHNESKPFIVSTQKMDFRVLGTSFNINSYSDADQVQAILVEGSLQLEQNYNSKIRVLGKLKPNEKITLNKINNKLYKANLKNIGKYISWKDGKHEFFNDPITRVVDKLGRWFNADIEIVDPEIQKYRYTATFTDESLEQVLELISMSSPIDYKLITQKKGKNNTYTKRKVKLYLKKNKLQNRYN